MQIKNLTVGTTFKHGNFQATARDITKQRRVTTILADVDMIPGGELSNLVELTFRNDHEIVTCKRSDVYTHSHFRV